MLKDACPTFRRMVESGVAQSADGTELKIHSQIHPDFSEALYRTVLREKPEVALEVGMAFGFSTLAVLSAFRELGRGCLISIDPNQSSQWHGAGKRAVELAELSNYHRLIEDFDYLALPELLKQGTKLGFAYIDGWHTFDYALLDWWYIERMLAVQGVVAFNDCHMPAVDKVLAFIRSHRRYAEIDSGLKIQELWQSRRTKLWKWLTGQKLVSPPRWQDRYFRKLEDWQPDWDFFAEF
jgi:predicted O-methyltransferase YrrM